MTTTVIFSDLDGSLLHPTTYSFQQVVPALESIRGKGIPLVLCSSKTRAEIEVYRRRLQNSDPFIVENGGAIFVPGGYFHFQTGRDKDSDYSIHAFGKPYEEIRKIFISLRQNLRVSVRGFGDMTTREISRLTGLPEDEAALARKREFGEPFLFEQKPDERFFAAIEERGLRWTRGRFFHLMGDNDKGKAVRFVRQLYEEEHGGLVTMGLGDGLNDLPMLEEVDHAVLLAKEDGNHDSRCDAPRFLKAKGIGPEGWNQAVLELLGR